MSSNRLYLLGLIILIIGAVIPNYFLVGIGFVLIIASYEEKIR